VDASPNIELTVAPAVVDLVELGTNFGSSLMARRWQVLLVTSVAVFMSFLDVTIVNIAFPDISASFPGSSLSRLSWILNAYTIVFAAALVPAGRLADRFGRRRFFFLGVLIFLAASAVCGGATSVGVLIGARAVQALGGAMLVPASLGLLLPEFPLERRATATALWGATGAIAAAAGPSVGGILVHWQGWRSVFFVNLVIGIPALIPARRLLRESREPQTVFPDALGAVWLAVGLGALALAIVEGPQWGWSSARVLGAFAASVLLLLAFVWRSARHPAPVIELSLFRVRSFAVANAGGFVFVLGLPTREHAGRRRSRSHLCRFRERCCRRAAPRPVRDGRRNRELHAPDRRSSRHLGADRRSRYSLTGDRAPCLPPRLGAHGAQRWDRCTDRTGAWTRGCALR
jgi:MFS family permease